MKIILVICAAALLIVGLAKSCHHKPASEWKKCERYADTDQQRLRCAIYYKPELIDSSFYPKKLK